MTEDNTEWQEWNMEVTFTFTYVNEGPFPVDMPDEERAEKVKEEFEQEWGEQFYQAYSSAGRHRLDADEPEKYHTD